jgi:hypothetical protein
MTTVKPERFLANCQRFSPFDSFRLFGDCRYFSMCFRIPKRSIRGLLVVAISMTTGCFNAESIIQTHRAETLGARLEEVDLGVYHISLPQPVETTAIAEIDFHVFGQVANRDLKKVIKLVEKNGPELRHRLLLAARQLKSHDVCDPELAALRTQIVSVFNETLPGEPLQSVGFYHFRYTNF